MSDIFSIGTRCGEWTIKKYLDGAGQSQIYLAERTDFRGNKIFAAIRTIKFSTLQSKDHLKKVKNAFAVEYEALEKFNSEFIAKVFDYGVSPDFWIATEFIEGESLEIRLSQGPLSLPEWTHLAKDAIRGLMHAHDRQVVHQDVKPGNIMLQADDGAAKWIDFGSASIIGMSDRGYNGASHTLAYVAPERMSRKQRGNSASDLYSLGVTLYEAATGQIPWVTPRGISTEAELLNYLYESKMEMKINLSILSEVQSKLIKALLNPDPKKRPNAKKALGILGAADAEVHGGTRLYSPATGRRAEGKGENTTAAGKSALDNTGQTPKGEVKKPKLAKRFDLGTIHIDSSGLDDEALILLKNYVDSDLAFQKLKAEFDGYEWVEPKVIGLERAEALEREDEELRNRLSAVLQQINASQRKIKKLFGALDNAPLHMRIELTKDLIKRYKASYASNPEFHESERESIKRRSTKDLQKESIKLLKFERKAFRKIQFGSTFDESAILISYRRAFKAKPKFEKTFQTRLETLVEIIIQGAEADEHRVSKLIGQLSDLLGQVRTPSRHSLLLLSLEYLFESNFQERHGDLQGGLFTTLQTAIEIWADQNLD